jgi:NapC/NirT cytochrome c family, N-terminal region
VTSRPVLVRHPLAIAGALITTASAVAFIALLIGMFLGLFENPYGGIVVFVLFPALFVIGLALMPLGMWLQRRKLLQHPELFDWPVLDFRQISVRRTALVIVVLTCINAAIVLVASYGALHAMESPKFCGQACHAPMHPQFTAWQQASHSRVACVACHIGEGPRGFMRAKLSGVRQLVNVAGNSYPRPIPAGAHMAAGAQAARCQGCHESKGGSRTDQIRVIREYADDEANTETMTVLQMHLAPSSSSPRAIHWHADPAVRVEYVATDPERQTIPFVKVTRADGSVKEYRAADATDSQITAGSSRTMDCVDCHNVVGHPMASTPEKAVDQAIAAGRVSRALPFARREGVRLLKASYPTQDEAERAIDRELRQAFSSRHGVDQAAVGNAVSAFQELYRSNVFPAMKVGWGQYPDNKGHVTSNGCFRCHDDSHKAKDGSTISADCEYCHRQIEQPAGRDEALVASPRSGTVAASPVRAGS